MHKEAARISRLPPLLYPWHSEKKGSITVPDLAACQLVVFDFDGTLANTTPCIIRTAETVLREAGLPEERMKDVPQLIGPPFPQAFSQVFGYSAKDAQMITNRYREIYSSLGPEAWPAFAGVKELLEALKASGRMLAIASSKRMHLVEKSAKDAGIAPFFSFIEGKRSDAPQTKAATLALVLDEAGTESAVMIGDRHYDIDAAHAVGNPGIGVLWGRTAPREELEGAGAEAIAETPEELGKILGLA